MCGIGYDAAATKGKEAEPREAALLAITIYNIACATVITVTIVVGWL